MIGLESLRWALTLALVAGSAFHLIRSVRPAGTEDRPAESLYLLMCVAMIAMIWPWGGAVPAAGWVAVFVLAAGWFTVRAVRSARRAVPAFFASATAAMAWMGAAAPAHAVGHAGMPPMATSTGTAWVSGALGVYLMLAAVWWVGSGMHLGGIHGRAATSGPAAAGATAHPVRWSWLCHGMMTAAMAVALLAMA